MGSKQLQITYSMWFYRDRKGLGANEQQTASSFLKWQQGEAGNSNKGFLWAATVSSGQAGASQDTDRDGLILTLSHPQGCGLQAYNSGSLVGVCWAAKEQVAHGAMLRHVSNWE